MNIKAVKAAVFLGLLALSVGYFHAALATSSVSTFDVNVTVSVCNNNGTCDSGETVSNCSADCHTGGGGGGEVVPDLSISGLSAGSITANSANISFATNRSALCSLQYGIDTAYASSTINESLYVGSHSIDLTGLSSSTTYHYKINCTDSLAKTAITGDNTFLTLTAIAPPPVPLVISGVATSNITKNSAQIAWQTNRDAQCQLHWGLTVDYSGGATSELVLSSAHSTSLSGLTASSIYHYYIHCVDAEAIAADSADFQFTTLEEEDTTPPANVTGLRSDPLDGRIMLYWRNPADADFSGVVIRRSTSFYPSINQGTLIFDGLGQVSGSERYFDDTGRVNGTTYFYSVFSYDVKRNYSSGVGVFGTPQAAPTDEEPTVEPPPTPVLPPGAIIGSGVGEVATSTIPTSTSEEFEARDLSFNDFSFSQETGSLNVSNDSVTARVDYGITISLPKSKVLPNTDKIVLNITVNNKLQAYLFYYDQAKDAFVVNLPALTAVGDNYATIIVLDSNNKALKILPGLIKTQAPQVEVLPSIAATIDNAVKTVQAVQEAFKPVSDAAQTTAGKTTAAATVAVSIAATAVGGPLINWWFLIQFLFTQPLSIFRFRKGWGTVYNAITKKPVDLALVRLYNAKTDKLITSRVTDKNGRYMFLVEPGEYYLKVEKIGFEYPSCLLKRARDDGNYLDLYYGDKISVTGENRSVIIANIPIDQQDMKISDKEILRRFSRARLSGYLSWFGPVLALAYYLIFPSWYSAALIVVHILMLLLFRRLISNRKQKNWGVVYAGDGKKPVKQAITRIFSSEYGRMLEYYVTDSRGRYGFLVGNNKYYVTADKQNLGSAKTPLIDMTGKKPDEIIAQDLILAENAEQKNEEIGSSANSNYCPVPEKPAMTEAGDKPVYAKPEITTPPDLSHIDLGSLDEAREKIESSKPVAQVEQSPATGSTEEISNKKDKEDIFG